MGLWFCCALAPCVGSMVRIGDGSIDVSGDVRVGPTVPFNDGWLVESTIRSGESLLMMPLDGGRVSFSDGSDGASRIQGGWF